MALRVIIPPSTPGNALPVIGLVPPPAPLSRPGWSQIGLATLAASTLVTLEYLS